MAAGAFPACCHAALALVNSGSAAGEAEAGMGVAAVGVPAAGVAVPGTLAVGAETVDAAVEDEALTLGDELVLALVAAELCGPQAATARQAMAIVPARGRY